MASSARPACLAHPCAGGGRTLNVSPKVIFTSFGDERILIADIVSPQSICNVGGYSAVCVSFVDVFREHGVKLKGHANIVGP
ncbi:hypothetical protein [Devosia crocina]|uniref:hypothetical protein n=1 Tax=Devosia crocina TaxID=429728 RepID=UPI000AF8F10D|nr:hypothetical protein [Devosia crocina]